MRGRGPGQRDDHRAPLSVEASSVTVQGRELTFPVEVRKARSWAAHYLVPFGPTRSLLEPTGLRPARVVPGKTVLSLVFVRYEDTDLDAYNELGVAFLVQRHPLDQLPRHWRIYIRHLPVNEEFTLEAGRALWGYPKFMAEVRIKEYTRGATCVLRQGGTEILTLTVRNGYVPMRQPAVPTYTNLDGVLRLTQWQTRRSRGKVRPGGGALSLGNHPIAQELRALGLPRRAVASSTQKRFTARFGAAQVLGSSA